MTKDQLADYRRNKRKGGRNFEKGASYENRFAVGRIAAELRYFLETGVDATFEAQSSVRFVDDLVVERPAEVNCFQLKNTDELYWGDGSKGSLLFDFYYEDKQLGGTDFSLNLIVSSEKRRALLESNRPQLLPSSANVQYFPDANIFALLRDGQLVNDLKAISKSSEPSIDQLSNLARSLLGRWCDRDGACKASDFIDPTVRIFLRSTKSDEEAQKQLRLGVKSVLDSIPNLEYGIVRGFFFYRYKHTCQTFTFDVFDIRFDTVQNWIETNRPAALPGIFEDMLVTWSEIQ